jgi:hypothetical protein
MHASSQFVKKLVARTLVSPNQCKQTGISWPVITDRVQRASSMFGNLLKLTQFNLSPLPLIGSLVSFLVSTLNLDCVVAFNLAVMLVTVNEQLEPQPATTSSKLWLPKQTLSTSVFKTKDLSWVNGAGLKKTDEKIRVL